MFYLWESVLNVLILFDIMVVDSSHFVKVSKWGESLGIRIPKEIVKKFGLADGDKVRLSENPAGFSVEKANPQKGMYYI